MLSFIDFSIPQVQAAIISGLFTIITTGVFGLIGIFISNRFKKDAEKAKNLERKLQEAINDIHFLLKVEKLHCERNQENFPQGYKIITRDKVRELYSPLKFSGKFTPGRVNNPDYNN